MNEEKDIRWLQRFDNYRKALFRLKQAVRIVSDNIEEDKDDEIAGHQFNCRKIRR